MKMSISRALKERKRIIGEMNTLRNRIETNNVVELNVKVKDDGTYDAPSADEIAKHRKLDPSKLMDEWYTLVRKLIDLKTKLQIANNGIAQKLITLSEMKAELQLVECMRPYDNHIHLYTEKIAKAVDVVFDSKWILNKTDELRQMINETQDEIDEYNATHYSEIDD